MDMEIALVALAVWLVLSLLATALFTGICRGGRLEDEDRAAWLAEQTDAAERERTLV